MRLQNLKPSLGLFYFRLKLPLLLLKKPILTASELDRYTRCPFQALVYYRWRLEDLRRPAMELRPDIKGIVLHEAVRKIMADPENSFLEKNAKISN